MFILNRGGQKVLEELLFSPNLNCLIDVLLVERIGQPKDVKQDEAENTSGSKL